jgi:hypothetical protein
LFFFFFFCSITSSPKSTRQSATTGIGHHINPLHNPYPNRQNQPIQQTGAMPQYGGGAEKCGRCSKSVYLAEKKVGGGRVCISLTYLYITKSSFVFSHSIQVVLAVIHVNEN